jgi:hypothetical protein
MRSTNMNITSLNFLLCMGVEGETWRTFGSRPSIVPPHTLNKSPSGVFNLFFICSLIIFFLPM